MSERRERCGRCGSQLASRDAATEAQCASCGRVWQAAAFCPAGHVLCDACQAAELRKVLADMALQAAEKDPLVIAERLMSLPQVPMLSCDHAFIAGGALLAAVRNSPYGRAGDEELREAFGRIGQQARSGYCALTGVCGIVPAVGAVFSVFLKAHCGSDREQRIVMEAVTRTARAITELTGPSCCKAYVRTAITGAVDMFAGTFGIVLPMGPVPPVCGHAERHPHGCREENCPYYRKLSRDIFAERKWSPGAVCFS